MSAVHSVNVEALDYASGEVSFSLRELPGPSRAASDGSTLRAAKNNDEVAVLAFNRIPFRTALRTDFYTGQRLRSQHGRLFSVQVNLGSAATFGTVGLSPDTDFSGWGVAPHPIRRAFQKDVRAAYLKAARASARDSRVRAVLVYVVFSYDTPIAWDAFAVTAKKTAAGVRWSSKVPAVRSREVVRTYGVGAESWTSTDRVYTAARRFVVPDVRYSNTTTSHQSALRLARLERRGGRWALPADRWGAGVHYVSIGDSLTVLDDPGAPRAGRGASPYGPRLEAAGSSVW